MNLDEILDQALEDFEKDNINKKAKNVMNKNVMNNKVSSSPSGYNSKTKTSRQQQAVDSTYGDEGIGIGTQQMIDGFNDPTFNDTLKTTLKSLSQTKQGGDTIDNLFQDLNTQYKPVNYNDFHNKNNMLSNLTNDPKNDISKFQNHDGDQAVEGTLKMLAEAQRGIEGYEAGAIEDTGEEIMNEMMKQFEELGKLLLR